METKQRKSWVTKAQERLQAHADKLFATWCQTKDGQRWKSLKRRVSPYQCGFSLPEYHHELIAAVGNGDEATAKYLMLCHYV